VILPLNRVFVYVGISYENLGYNIT